MVNWLDRIHLLCFSLKPSASRKTSFLPPLRSSFFRATKRKCCILPPVSLKQEVRADITIDASGFARHLGVRTDMGKAFHRYGFGAEYDLYAPDYPQDELFLIMGSAYAPNGYAWAFPRGNGRVRLGVGVLHPDNDDDARVYLDRIMCDIPQLAQCFKGASPLEYHTGLFPSENYLERFSRDGLAGDAGGHGSTLVREGIRFAIYSGQMAQLEGEQKQVRLLGVSLSNLVPENGMSSQQIYTSQSLWISISVL